MITGVSGFELGGRAVVLMTGGKDSSVCFEVAKDLHNSLIPVYYNFGQENQTRNAQYATQYVYDVDHSDSDCEVLSLEYIDMGDFFFGPLVNEEVDRQEQFMSTFDHPEFDEGEFTYVPMRTVGMMAKLAVLSDRLDADYLYFGFNGDEPLEDADESDEALRLGEKFVQECSLPGHDISVVNPLSGLDSAQVISLGERYGVEWKATCSCCEPGRGHCGECSSCVDRERGFREAGIEDPAP